MNQLLDKTFFKRYLFGVAVIWLLLTLLVMYYGDTVLKPTLHYFASLAESMTSGYSIKMHDSLLNDESIIIMVLKAEQAIHTVGGAVLVARGASTPVFAYTSNILVPVVILFSLILAWPFSSLKQYITALVIGLVFMQIILVLTVPFQLLGIYENQLLEVARTANDSYPFSIWHYWQMFCDGGAVWLLALLSAMLVISIARAVPVSGNTSPTE